MTQSEDQLVVRQFERLVCRIAADIRVDQEFATAVTLSRSVGDGSGTVAATMVDCSRGGLGLESKVFFPRSARLRVRLRETPPGAGSGTAAPPGGIGSVELVGRIQRVTMISREPLYYVGLAFVDPKPEQLALVTRLLRSDGVSHAAPGLDAGANPGRGGGGHLPKGPGRGEARSA